MACLVFRQLRLSVSPSPEPSSLSEGNSVDFLNFGASPRRTNSHLHKGNTSKEYSLSTINLANQQRSDTTLAPVQVIFENKGKQASESSHIEATSSLEIP